MVAEYADNIVIRLNLNLRGKVIKIRLKNKM